VILTHPDFDHFLGMRELLERFSTADRSVGLYGDAGFTGKHMKGLTGRADETGQLIQLRETVIKLARANKLKFWAFGENTVPITTKTMCNGGRVTLTAIAPSRVNVELAQGDAYTTLKKNPDAVVPSNLYSIVFALNAKYHDQEWTALLTADADPEPLAAAISNWHNAGPNVHPQFDLLKVPHHGSHLSHNQALCQMRSSQSDSNPIAVICAGMRNKLPSQSVLTDYLQSKWSLMCTTTRHAVLPRNQNLLSLKTRSKTVSPSSKSHCVVVKWTPGVGTSAQPTAALIEQQDLHAYAETTRGCP
jgi:beta-lactamase superfamily II metal-dependent hydrolase